MNKKTIITILLALVAMVGQAKVKAIVWEQPTTEFVHHGFTSEPTP